MRSGPRQCWRRAPVPRPRCGRCRKYRLMRTRYLTSSSAFRSLACAAPESSTARMRRVREPFRQLAIGRTARLDAAAPRKADDQLSHELRVVEPGLAAQIRAGLLSRIGLADLLEQFAVLRTGMIAGTMALVRLFGRSRLPAARRPRSSKSAEVEESESVTSARRQQVERARCLREA